MIVVQYQDLTQLVIDKLESFLCSNKVYLRQGLLEILIPPHHVIKNPSDYTYAKEIKPIIELLVTKAEDFERGKPLPKEVEDQITAFETFFSGNPKLNFINSQYEAMKEKQQNKPLLRFKLTQWFAYATGILLDLNDTQVKEIESSGLLLDILKYRNPSNRFSFIRRLSYLAANNIEDLKQRHELTHIWGRLTWILFASMKALGLSDISAIELSTMIDKKTSFKDTKRLNALVKLLLEVIENEPFSTDEMMLF